jgi:hypothetical protein
MNRGTDVPDFLAASQARVENPPPVQEHMQPGRSLLKAAIFRAVDRAGMASLWPAMQGMANRSQARDRGRHRYRYRLEVNLDPERHRIPMTLNADNDYEPNMEGCQTLWARQGEDNHGSACCRADELPPSRHVGHG